MSLPDWAEDVVAAHSIFENAGIELDVRWNGEKGRVEAVCHDIPPYTFPTRSWYVTREIWESQPVRTSLNTQLDYIQEYLNG